MALASYQSLAAVLLPEVVSIQEIAEAPGAAQMDYVYGTWAAPSAGKLKTRTAAAGDVQVHELVLPLYTIQTNVTAAYLGSSEPTSLRDPLLRLPARVTVASGSAAKVDVQAFKSDGAGGVSGSDLGLTAEQTLSTAFADYDFTLDGSGLATGDALAVFIKLTLDDSTGNSGAKIELAAPVWRNSRRS